MKTKATKAKPAETTPAVNAVLSNSQVAAALAISVRKLQEMISVGEFPRCDFRMPGGDSPRWRVATLNSWVDAQTAKSKG